MKTIHVQKFDSGRRTPQEMHRQFAFPPHARCSGCGSRQLAVRAVIMVPLDEAVRRGLVRQDELDQSVLKSLIVPIQDSSTARPTPFVRLSMTYSCTGCRKDFEKALAKSPSWAIVEINEGPDPTNKVVLGYS